MDRTQAPMAVPVNKQFVQLFKRLPIELRLRIREEVERSFHWLYLEPGEPLEDGEVPPPKRVVVYGQVMAYHHVNLELVDEIYSTSWRNLRLMGIVFPHAWIETSFNPLWPKQGWGHLSSSIVRPDLAHVTGVERAFRFMGMATRRMGCLSSPSREITHWYERPYTLRVYDENCTLSRLLDRNL